MASGNVFDDLTTRDIIAIVRQWRLGQLGSKSLLGASQQFLFQPALPYVSNDSGEAIPPYGCMQITGTVEIGSRNYLVVDKPSDTDGTAGAFIFNGHREIADAAEGLAQLGPVVRGFKDIGTATGGERWQPVSGEWYIEQDDAGQFICCGDDAVLDDVVKVVLAAKGADRLFKTPGGGIPAATGSGPYTFGTAACTPVGLAGVVGSGTVTITNIVNKAIAANVVIKAAPVEGGWVVDVASCGA